MRERIESLDSRVVVENGGYAYDDLSWEETWQQMLQPLFSLLVESLMGSA